MNSSSTLSPVYGLMAEFESPTELVHAAKAAYEAGYRKMDTYSPYPIEEAAEAIGSHHNRVALVVLIGAMLGMIGGYSMEFWISAVNYPLNVGGKPYHSWPAFIPVTFECAILGAGLAAVFGMLALNGLPQPYHPVFNSPNFIRASRDRFFLCIESQDPQFRLSETKGFLEGFHPVEVTEVPY
ncbi:MAG TPA: DUF3341 domain-containing protein [Candidatus Angelobacter sp.]|nr:DUF3341 domain-containing protein [Candidatus Angelobacter sp.]